MTQFIIGLLLCVAGVFCLGWLVHYMITKGQ